MDSAAISGNSVPTVPVRSSFALIPAAIAFTSLECLVAIQALSAYRDRFFTATQMQDRGVEQGLPFVWHFAMWSDLLIISSVAAYMIGQYFRRWQLRWILVSFAIGAISAAALSW